MKHTILCNFKVGGQYSPFSIPLEEDNDANDSDSDDDDDD